MDEHGRRWHMVYGIRREVKTPARNNLLLEHLEFAHSNVREKNVFAQTVAAESYNLATCIP